MTTGVLIGVFLLGYLIRRGLEFFREPTVFKRIISGPIQGGNLDGQDKEIQKVILKDYAELTVANAAAGTTETLDIEAGNVFHMTLDENITFTFSNPIASDDMTSFTLILTQDGSGTNVVTWPASVDWAGGSAPTLITTAGTVSILVFFTIDGGTIWHGMLGSSDSS